ncbi:MAG: nucleoside phosphorylase [Oscillospiraceae bacterium]|nr:nucleoside phosphorylase [Oscillospiraceae bacterium]
MKQPHIFLDESLGISYAVLPGDPARLDRIAPLLENVEELAYNREFRSLRGTYKGTDILAISTGIGGCSAGIAVEELHNIGVKAMIRTGSCGALQNGIGLGELIVVSGAVRDDGASKAYVPECYPAYADIELLSCVIDAAEKHGITYHEGLSHSHESFYHDEADAASAYWSAKGVLGADMESAALFTIARLRGVKAASVLNNVVLYGQDTADAIGDYVDGAALAAQGERNELLVALEAFVLLNGKHPEWVKT